LLGDIYKNKKYCTPLNENPNGTDTLKMKKSPEISQDSSLKMLKNDTNIQLKALEIKSESQASHRSTWQF
jgi:hypothetical protein